MAYCALSDLVKRVEPDLIVQLADDDQDGSADADVIAAAIADAEATIDAYLAGRYSVPFADGSVPAVVKTWAEKLAILYLKRRRYQTLEDGDRGMEKDVYRALEAVRDGRMDVERTSVDERDKAKSSTDGADGKFVGDGDAMSGY